MKDRTTNEVRAQHIPAEDMRHVPGFVAAHTKRGSKVYTDDALVYDILDAWYDHETVKHSASEYVRGEVHTNGIEGFWSLFKLGFYGTYHKMSPKHLDRYVREFTGRNNIRDMGHH